MLICKAVRGTGLGLGGLLHGTYGTSYVIPLRCAGMQFRPEVVQRPVQEKRRTSELAKISVVYVKCSTIDVRDLAGNSVWQRLDNAVGTKCDIALTFIPQDLFHPKPIRTEVGMELQEGRISFGATIEIRTHIVDDEHAHGRLELSQTLTRRSEANGREVTGEQEDIVDDPVGQVGQTQRSVDSESVAVELAPLPRAFFRYSHHVNSPADTGSTSHPNQTVVVAQLSAR